MKPKSESPADVQRWLQQQADTLWPAALGSLSLRRSPCVRQRCPACLSGEQHLSYVLYGRLPGRRFSLYVPQALVPEVRRCLDNGRALQELLHQAAPRYVQKPSCPVFAVSRVGELRQTPFGPNEAVR